MKRGYEYEHRIVKATMFRYRHLAWGIPNLRHSLRDAPQAQHIPGRTELGELLGVKPATAVKYVMEPYRNGLVQIDEYGLAWLCSRQYEDFLHEYLLDLEDAARYDTTEAAK